MVAVATLNLLTYLYVVELSRTELPVSVKTVEQLMSELVAQFSVTSLDSEEVDVSSRQSNGYYVVFMLKRTFLSFHCRL